MSFSLLLHTQGFTCPTFSPSPLPSPCRTASCHPRHSLVDPACLYNYVLLPGDDEDSLDADDHTSRSTRAFASRDHARLLPVMDRRSLARFLADFTLGFADGLTVPFALTAGLSSLGRSETVVLAGLAEICAGSMSMGIGGYLSAKGTRRDEKEEIKDRRPLPMKDVEAGGERGTSVAVIESYLAPLDLPPRLRELVAAHVERNAELAQSLESRKDDKSEEDDELQTNSSGSPANPVFSGLSVASGYLLGGLLPLLPYLFVTRIAEAMLLSFIVCICALFVFGFTKDLVLSRLQTVLEKGDSSLDLSWRDLRHSAWEGTQMVILGSVAALAAVLCVRWFEGGKGES